jgi:hypothetical protein
MKICALVRSPMVAWPPPAWLFSVKPMPLIAPVI